MGSLISAWLGLKDSNDMYVSMLQSQSVEDGIIKRFHLMSLYHKKRLSDTRKILERQSEIAAGVRDGLIRISVTDKDPQRAAAIANAYVDEFRKLSEGLAITEASRRRLFFQQQLAESKDNLAKAEEALKKTEEKTGILELSSQARALVDSAADLRAQLAVKQVEVQGMKTFATDQNSQYLLAQQEIKGLQRQLSKLASAGVTSDSSDSLLLPRGQVTTAGLEYVRKLRDVKYYETIFDILAKQYEVAKLDEAREGPIIQVIDPALVPDRKSSPHRLLIVLLSTVLAAIFSTAWIVTRQVLLPLYLQPDGAQQTSKV